MASVGQLSGDQRQELQREFLRLRKDLGLPEVMEPRSQPKNMIEGFFLSHTGIPKELDEKLRDVGENLERLTLDGLNIQAKRDPELARKLSRYAEVKEMLHPSQRKTG
ncbi:MAG: hypothetical protein ABIH11_02560 [Candidatus Altiarchaeota archaeon]